MKSALVPAVEWLARYERPSLRADVLAGLTTAAVVIPKAMAYATIAGLPVQIGLYTALVPMAVYAVLGSSRPLSVSTTTTLGILCAAALADPVLGAEPAALVTAGSTLALLTGAILLLTRLLRLGFAAPFQPGPARTSRGPRMIPGSRSIATIPAMARTAGCPRTTAVRPTSRSRPASRTGSSWPAAATRGVERTAVTGWSWRIRP